MIFNSCVIGVFFGLVIINYYFYKSTRCLINQKNLYTDWYNNLEYLEGESHKWKKLYWKFEQNNMLLQRVLFNFIVT